MKPPFAVAQILDPARAGRLPVAGTRAVWRYVRNLFRAHPADWALMLVLHGAGAVTALVLPWLVGQLVDGVEHGTTTGRVDLLIGAMAAAAVVHATLARFATMASARLGEQTLAELREDFVDRTLAIPLSTVERAGTGDLVSRTSRDVDALSRSVRFAVPQILIATVSACFAAVALVLVGPIFAVPCLLGVPILGLASRWYLKRAPQAYLAESAALAEMTDGMTETITGGRTVEALGRERGRFDRTQADIARAFGIQRYTLWLRTCYFPGVEMGQLVPVVLTLLLGGWYYAQGWAQLWQVASATLLVQQLTDPILQVLNWLNELQVGRASLARLLGVSEVPDDRTPGTLEPRDVTLAANDVRFSYVDEREVLSRITLDVRPGERLAMVGPSGAGKSTLGRLLAGIYPPGSGEVTVGGVPLVELPLSRLRGEVALVSQEHHVFIGTLRENVALARPAASDDELRAALAAVDAWGWAEQLPAGLDTELGSGAHVLTPAQEQQLALARLVIADPHTLVLDEATSLIDPRAARHLERSLAGVLEGRTVIAIAHRLFSAHDADRVAVLEDGRITELGPHGELMAAGGAYAALWRSWNGRVPSAAERGEQVNLAARSTGRPRHDAAPSLTGSGLSAAGPAARWLVGGIEHHDGEATDQLRPPRGPAPRRQPS